MNQEKKGYFDFTKKDRVGILVIVLIMGLIYLLPKFASKEPRLLDLKEDSILAKSIDTFQFKQRKRQLQDYNSNYVLQHEPSLNTSFINSELFTFDPNTLSTEGWKRLGLNEKTIRILNNYRNKGGRFYKPEDLKKVWTMPEGFYERVKGHITITSLQAPPSYSNFNKPATKSEERKIQAIDINESDTAAFISLPGIGTVLATRIIKFREKLGGFHSIDQIRETYGLPDSTFQKLKPYFTISHASIKRLNINTATKDDLKAHPYIKWSIANAIVEYRNQHGKYQTLNDLTNIVLIDEATFLKLKNYLTAD